FHPGALSRIGARARSSPARRPCGSRGDDPRADCRRDMAWRLRAERIPSCDVWLLKHAKLGEQGLSDLYSLGRVDQFLRRHVEREREYFALAFDPSGPPPDLLIPARLAEEDGAVALFYAQNLSHLSLRLCTCVQLSLGEPCYEFGLLDSTDLERSVEPESVDYRADFAIAVVEPLEPGAVLLQTDATRELLVDGHIRGGKRLPHRHVLFPGFDQLWLTAIGNDLVHILHSACFECDQAVRDLECGGRDETFLCPLRIDQNEPIRTWLVKRERSSEAALLEHRVKVLACDSLAGNC